MGIFKSLFRGGYDIPAPNVSGGWDQGGEWLKWEAPLNLVRGENRYQESLRSLAGPVRRHGYLLPVAVTFTREPKNPADRNAVRAEIKGVKVGYLAEEVAAVLAPMLDKARCPAFTLAGIVRGGGQRTKSFGVHVWPGRRLSPGPQFEGSNFSDFEISWPPYGVEGSDRND